MTNKKLTCLSDIYTFFQENETPIYFINTTTFNVLGLDQWIRSFRYVSYFDSFDGYHPRVLNPKDLGDDRVFGSKEEIVNWLLRQRSTHDMIHAGGGNGYMFSLMFDNDTERLADESGLTMAMPSDELRTYLDSKVVTTRLGNEAGVSSAPNALGRASTWEELRTICDRNDLGDELVVQTPHGDSGKTTFFINSESDWDKCSDQLVDQDLKVMKYIRHIPYALEAVTTRCGTMVGPILADITGYEEITIHKGGWAGNDISRNLVSEMQAASMRKMTKALGERLYEEGYKGTFCVDFLACTDSDEVFLGELNPRVSGISALTNLVTSKYAGAPLMLFHLLEFMDMDFDIDVEAISERWQDLDTWSQLIFKQVDHKSGLITKAPLSGIWRMRSDDSIRFVRRGIDWHNVANESEAFYMRIYGAGDYMYHGADIGILISRGRMQTDGRQLTDRAKRWVKALENEFELLSDES
ncbi:MAG: biotin carboxylase [Gammaproteobacteria bacterium]|nr:biotin carboxylase [Gammaproteobacteria bacterium]